MDILINGVPFKLDNVEQISVHDAIYSSFRGWMSPDGELHEMYGIDGHIKLAREHLRKTSSDPIKDLQDAGWIRVVCQNSFSCARLDANTKRLLFGIVLKQLDSAGFFFQIGDLRLEMSRDEAIAYLGS